MPDLSDGEGSDGPPMSLWRRAVKLTHRRTVIILVVAAIIAGVDVGMAHAIHRWQAEAVDLRADATELGELIAIEQAVTEYVHSEATLESAQGSAAEDRASVLADEAMDVRTRADQYRDVALAFDACWRNRDLIVHGLFNHGRQSVQDLVNQTTPGCTAAADTLNALQAAEG